MAFEDGPFVQVACFCETVLQEVNGAHSLIRIIDTLIHTQTGPNPPKELPPFNYPLTMVLMFKSGMALGRSTLKVVPHLPTGETRDPLLLTIHFEGEEKGANVTANITFPFEYEGVYWFKVYLTDPDEVADKLMTAIPLRVKYNRVIAGQRL